MRINVILIFLISFGTLVGVTVMRTEDSLFAERSSGLNFFLEGQTSGLVPALDAEVKSLGHDLVLGFENLSSKKPESFDLSQPYSRFLMVAKLTAPQTGAEWEFAESYFRAETAVKPWAVSYSKNALKSVEEEKVIRGSLRFFALLDPNRTPHILIVHRTGRNDWYAGLLGAEVFQAVMDRQKGVGSEVYLVSQSGQAVGHGTAEYVGAMLTEDPVVKEFLKSNKVRSSLDFSRGKKKMRAIYEQIPTTNLVLVVAAQATGSGAFRSTVLMPMIFLAAGIFVVALVLLLLLDRPPKMAPPRPLASATAFSTAAAGPAAVIPPASAPIPSVASAADKMDSIKVSASALAHELKAPLLSILAQAQKIKLQHPEMSGEIEALEKFAREGRGSLQKIFAFTGEDLDHKIESFNPVDVVLAALQKAQGAISKKGVLVEKDTKVVSHPKGNAALLQKALGYILGNSLEAMEHSITKKLRIEVSEQAGQIEIRVRDSGDGIAASDVLKVFDPFFTTRKARGHMGMGLSAAQAMVKEMGGKISIEQTEQKKGTTVLIQLPIAGVTASAMNPSPAAKAPVAATAPAATVAPTPAVAPAAPVAKPETKPIAAPVPKKPELIPQATVDLTLKMIDELDPVPPPPSVSAEFGDLDIPTLVQEVPSINSLRAGSPSAAPLPKSPPSAPPMAPPPVPSAAVPPSGPKAPSIQINLPKKKVDGLKVNIRRPGDKA